MWVFLKTILMCLCIMRVYSSKIENDPIFRYDYKYYEKIQGWLKFHVIPEKWHDARLRCKLEGAELASPVNKEIQEAMLNHTYGEVREVFSGTHSLFSYGEYFSVKGIPLERMPVKWALGGPVADSSKRCIVLVFSARIITNADCDLATFPYFCYKKYDFEPITACGTIDTEYTYVSKLDACYKFHDEKKTWQDSFKTCSAEGGHLAIINSDEELKYLNDSINEVDLNSQNNKFHIGVTYWRQPDQWVTVHGDDIPKLRMLDWAADLHKSYDLAFCGYLTRNSVLSSGFCSEKHAFICEKTTDSLKIKKL